ncbi:MAG: 30S ribosomal protein S1 [Chloroflexi bacterium]|nr:30S ribosomal protein S1 [Chloroflexota bacterium]
MVTNKRFGELIMGESAKTTQGLKDIKRKTLFKGRVLKITLAGAIVDIGLTKPGVVHISQLQKDPVKRVEDMLKIGDELDVWVRSVNKKRGYVELTMIEPVGLEWGDIKKGMNLKGSVTRLEKFGAFIEVGAERPGLVHISELTHDYIKSVEDAVKVGDEVEAKVLDFDRRKKQIKLSLKALKDDPAKFVFEEEDDEEEEEEVPTAMELALRKAMEGDDKEAKAVSETEPEAGTGKLNKEREEILSRTLENKVRTE